MHDIRNLRMISGWRHTTKAPEFFPEPGFGPRRINFAYRKVQSCPSAFRKAVQSMHASDGLKNREPGRFLKNGARRESVISPTNKQTFSRRNEVCKVLRVAALFAVVFWSIAGRSASAAESDAPAADLHETVVNVPMEEKGLFGTTQRDLVATTYMPDGAGPFPLIVLSHGSPPDALDRPKIGRYRKLAQIREFVHMGFAVIVPIRRGYGATGGSDAEDAGSCKHPNFEGAGNAAAADLLATIKFADTLPQVDRTRIILVGQSAGGFASLAAASFAPPGLVAVVNFSGGRGGRPATHPGAPCEPELMADAIGHFAATTRVPVLWHYVENDQYFAPDVVRTWFGAFQGAGGHGELVMEPPFGQNGHGMFAVDSAIPIWMPHFVQFVSSVIPLAKQPPAAPGISPITAPTPASSSDTD
jgi:dienelactone hydrolase